MLILGKNFFFNTSHLTAHRC